MNSYVPRLLVCACFAASVAAQAQDIGLILINNSTGGNWGQFCGPVSCTPVLAPPLPLGDQLLVTCWGPPNSPYVIAIGLPTTCTQVSGLDNALLLGNAIVIDVGVTLMVPPLLPCAIAAGTLVLPIPVQVPSGFVFRFQALAISANGRTAFSPAIETATL